MINHRPHPGPSTPAWAVPSAEYLAKHASCRHAWGSCEVSCIYCLNSANVRRTFHGDLVCVDVQACEARRP